MKARDIMTPHLATALPTDTVLHVARLMRDRRVGMILIVENTSTMRLVGVVTDRDLVVRCLAQGLPAENTIREYMSAGPIETVGPGDTAQDIAERMERVQVRRLPVVEHGDRIVGIVAQADLATKVGPDEPELIEEVLESISRAPVQA